MKKVKAPYVAIRFLDHCHTDPVNAGLVECEVVGRLYKQDEGAFYVVSWIREDSFNSHDNEVFCIAKKLVISMKVFP